MRTSYREIMLVVSPCQGILKRGEEEEEEEEEGEGWGGGRGGGGRRKRRNSSKCRELMIMATGARGKQSQPASQPASRLASQPATTHTEPSLPSPLPAVAS